MSDDTWSDLSSVESVAGSSQDNKRSALVINFSTFTAIIILSFRFAEAKCRLNIWHLLDILPISK